MEQKILIAGGGLGGLCLAQGLKKAGIPCLVFERDETKSTREQGYRINIDSDGLQALRSNLPADLFQTLLGTCASSGGQFVFGTSQMQKLLSFNFEKSSANGNGNSSVSRIVLRKILLSGLEDVVRFGKRVARFEQRPDGVTLFFEDGSSEEGTLLVGADGVHSAVRKQLMPDAEPRDTGAIGIAAKIPLDAHGRSITGDELLSGTGLFFGPKGRAIFFARHEFTDKARSKTSPLDLQDEDVSSYAFTALLCRTDDFGMASGADAVRNRLIEMTEGWHPHLRRLLQECDPDSIRPTTLRVAPDLTPRKPSNVTLIGDAVHCMPPTGGVGGNTALKDARVLCEELVLAKVGKLNLVDAVGAYEEQMREYGFKAVRESMGNLNGATSTNPVSQIASRVFFRVVDNVPALKRKIFEA